MWLLLRTLSLSADAPPDPFLAKPGTGPDASAFTGEEPEDRKNGSSHTAAEEPKDGTDKEQVLIISTAV